MQNGFTGPYHDLGADTVCPTCRLPPPPPTPPSGCSSNRPPPPPSCYSPEQRERERGAGQRLGNRDQKPATPATIPGSPRGSPRGSPFTWSPRGSPITWSPRGSPFTWSPRDTPFTWSPRGTPFTWSPRGSPLPLPPSDWPLVTSGVRVTDPDYMNKYRRKFRTEIPLAQQLICVPVDGEYQYNKRIF